MPTKDGIDLGRIASMELNHKSVDTARAGQSVAMKIEGSNDTERSRLFGRHFDHTDALVRGRRGGSEGEGRGGYGGGERDRPLGKSGAYNGEGV